MNYFWLKKRFNKKLGRIQNEPMSVFITFKINRVKCNKWPKMRILITNYSNIRPKLGLLNTLNTNIHTRDHMWRQFLDAKNVDWLDCIFFYIKDNRLPRIECLKLGRPKIKYGYFCPSEIEKCNVLRKPCQIMCAITWHFLK